MSRFRERKTYVITARHLRGCKLGVIRSATSGVNPPPSNTLFKDRIFNLKVQNLVNLYALLLKSGIQLQRSTVDVTNGDKTSNSIELLIAPIIKL